MFIFDKHKLFFYISRALWLRKYGSFGFSRDDTIEMSRDFLGGPADPDSPPYQVLETVGLVNVEIKGFDLTRDYVIDVSRDFVGELSLGSIRLVKLEI